MLRLRPFLAILVGTLLLMSVSVVAGRPSVFSDTDDYFAEGRNVAEGVDGLLHGKLFFDVSQMHERLSGEVADEEPVHNQDGARSAYYGAVLYALERVGTLWLAAAAQAALASWLLFVVWRAAAPRAPLWNYGALMAGLTVGTSLPFFTGFAMPDVFAGFAPLTLAALFFYGDRLGRTERLSLWVVLTCCINFHSSNLLTAVGLTVFAAIVLALLRTPWKTIAGLCGKVIVTMVVALVAAQAFAVAVKLRTGDDFRRPPFLMARVLANGPGRAYLQVACDRGDKLALCQFRHNPLNDEEDILWEDDPKIGIFNSQEFKVRERLEKEETRFVLGAIAYDPVGQIAASLKNWGTQLTEFSLDEPLKDPVYYLTDPYWRTTNQRPQVLHMGWCPPLDQGCKPRLSPAILAPWQIGVIALSLGFLGWRFSRRDALAAIRQRAGEDDMVRLACLAGLLVLAVIVNAAVCGALSGPFPRYQARLIWLIPAVAGIAVAALSPAWRARADWRKVPGIGAFTGMLERVRS